MPAEAPPAATAPPAVLPGEPVERVLDRLRGLGAMTVEGSLVLRGVTGPKEGTFSLVISGDDLTMNITAGGIRAGQVVLRGNTVTMSPQLKDTFMEYMFAVIVRDSITWWNIAGYSVERSGDAVIVRNSWKKVYLDPAALVPRQQLFRLLYFREVTVNYASPRDFGAVSLPTEIRFSFNAYDCVLRVEKAAFAGTVREPAAPGP